MVAVGKTNKLLVLVKHALSGAHPVMPKLIYFPFCYNFISTLRILNHQHRMQHLCKINVCPLQHILCFFLFFLFFYIEFKTSALLFATRLCKNFGKCNYLTTWYILYIINYILSLSPLTQILS